MRKKVYEKGYKAYEPGLVCRGKQYRENEVYEERGGELCMAGMMHYCVNPFDVLNYYPLVTEKGQITDFTEVEALDPPKKDKDKSATKRLRVGVKLGLDGFVKACVDFLYEKTIKDMPKGKISSGDGAKIGSSGDDAQIGSSGDAAKIGSSGDYAQIGSSGYAAKIGSSGYDAQIGSSGYAAKIGSSGYAAQIGSSGDDAKIGSSGYAAQIGSSGYAAKIGSSGYYAKIGSSGYAAKIGSSGDGAKIGSSGRYAQIGSSGDDAQITVEADHAVVGCIGKRGRVKATIGTWITLAEYGEHDGSGYPCVCVKSAQIDGETLKPDTWYTLKNGEFEEVSDD